MRVVTAAELHAQALADKHSSAAENREDEGDEKEDGGPVFDIVGENGEVLVRNNRLTVDDPSRQALTMDEIEALKKANAGSGKEIIEKIIASHSAIGEKTSFSLAKYTLRKSSKYMKRFTVLPLDVNLLTQLISEKESSRIMDMRMESLGLLTSWANVHYGTAPTEAKEEEEQSVGGGRWLVVEDTAGLVVAAMAEKMGILHQRPELQSDDESEDEEDDEAQPTIPNANGDTAMEDAEAVRTDPKVNTDESALPADQPSKLRKRRPHKYGTQAQAARSNTITVIHPNSEPNLSLLTHFGNINPLELDREHPLYSHLKTITWLQLLEPEADSAYQEPPFMTDQQLKAMKSSKRTQYHKKRWRWQRVKDVVEETQKGGFDGLVVASNMTPKSVLKHLVPLVRGGGQIAVFSPNVEPLTALMDYYSRDRRAAFVTQTKAKPKDAESAQTEEEEDFPLDPTLVINPMLQTSRARHWQVLPGRTHPFMTSKGGPEGYVFTATKVIPLAGHVEARGKFGKKRKVEDGNGQVKAEAAGGVAETTAG